MMWNVLAMESAKVVFANARTLTGMRGTGRNVKYPLAPSVRTVLCAVEMESAPVSSRSAFVSPVGLEWTVQHWIVQGFLLATTAAFARTLILANADVNHGGPEIRAVYHALMGETMVTLQGACVTRVTAENRVMLNVQTMEFALMEAVFVMRLRASKVPSVTGEDALGGLLIATVMGFAM